VLEGHALPSLEQTLCFAPFGSLLYIGIGCQLTAAHKSGLVRIHSAAQHTLAGAVISSCLVASAPTPVSPLGSLPRFELFLLRPALATFVPPFWDVRFPFVGVAIEGNGSTPFFPAAMAGSWWMCVVYAFRRSMEGVGVFEETMSVSGPTSRNTLINLRESRKHDMWGYKYRL
jgi:hypothetical protein